MFLFLFIPAIAWGGELFNDPIPPETIEKMNAIFKKLYDEILAEKPKYKELEGFDETALTKNQYGFYAINYATEIPSAGGRTTPYAFGLTIDNLLDKTYTKKMGYFKYPMQISNLRLSGYLVKHPLRRQFNIKPLVDKYYEDMVDDQQVNLPIKLMIVFDKDTYQVGEELNFKVVLANMSKQNVLVKGLSKDTLFFTLNREYWGTKSSMEQEKRSLTKFELLRQRQEAAMARIQAKLKKRKSQSITERGIRTKVGEQTILRGEEALTLEFVGEGYKTPQEVEIRGTYQMSIHGVRPTASTHIKIVE